MRHPWLRARDSPGGPSGFPIEATVPAGNRLLGSGAEMPSPRTLPAGFSGTGFLPRPLGFATTVRGRSRQRLHCPVPLPARKRRLLSRRRSTAHAHFLDQSVLRRPERALNAPLRLPRASLARERGSPQSVADRAVSLDLEPSRQTPHMAPRDPQPHPSPPSASARPCSPRIAAMRSRPIQARFHSLLFRLTFGSLRPIMIQKRTCYCAKPDVSVAVRRPGEPSIDTRTPVAYLPEPLSERPKP